PAAPARAAPALFAFAPAGPARFGFPGCFRRPFPCLTTKAPPLEAKGPALSSSLSEAVPDHAARPEMLRAAVQPLTATPRRAETLLGVQVPQGHAGRLLGGVAQHRVDVGVDLVDDSAHRRVLAELLDRRLDLGQEIGRAHV